LNSAHPSISLGEVVDFSSGKSIKPGGPGRYPAFGSNGLIGHAEDYLYSEGIVVGRVGAYCGSVALSMTPFWASDNTIVIRPRPSHGVSLRYLFYVLHAADLNKQSGGAAQPLLTQRDLRPLRIPFPSRPIQRKIAAILSAYDDLIENNNRRIKLFEEMAERVYREWFVDIRYPGHDGVRLVRSERGSIPEGWKVEPLRESVELCYGKALKAGDRRGGTVPVFGSGGHIGLHDQALVQGPGIIIGRKGNVGSVNWSEDSFFPIDTTYYVKTDLPLTYTFFALRDLKFVDSHAAVPGLSREQAYALPWLTPDQATLARFDTLASAIFELRSRLERAATNLRSTRDLLLPRLISGEIDVDELDISAEEAAA
jgi:type I restriction enzyme, S subunit